MTMMSLCGNPFITAARQGVKRAPLGKGGKQIVRKPLTGVAKRDAQRAFRHGRVEGRVAWIDQSECCFLMLRGSELIAGEKRVFHNVYLVRFTQGGRGVCQSK